MVLWIVGGVVAGAVVGVIANFWAHKRGSALMPDLILGVLGAAIAGVAFTAFVSPGLRGLGVAALGAALPLFISHGPDVLSE